MDAKICKQKNGAWDANRKRCYNVGKIKKLTMGGLTTEGSHHKQWFLEEIAKKLRINTKGLEYFEKGIAP